MLLIILPDSEKYLLGLAYGRLVYSNGLETSFERTVLFDVFALFLKGRCADYLNLAS